jgi:glucokinase
MTAGKILVFDIGGTSTRAGLYSVETGAIERLRVKPTPSQWNSPQLTRAEIYQSLIELIMIMGHGVARGEAVRALSIAFPGPIDRLNRIMEAPGILGENPAGPIDLVADLKEIWPDLPICLSNDMTAAGYRYRQALDDSFCLVTVSTGVGNKVFIDGVPQLGSTGAGGEIGHLKVLFDKDAPLCGCGKRGHLQAISSGHGTLEFIRNSANKNRALFKQSLLAQLAECPDNISNHMVAEAYRAEDPFATQQVHQCSQPLAATLATLHLALGLERFVIIGGFALALGAPYLNNLARQAEECCWNAASSWATMLEFGQEDDLSGLIGAGKLVISELGG